MAVPIKRPAKRNLTVKNGERLSYFGLRNFSVMIQRTNLDNEEEEKMMMAKIAKKKKRRQG